MNLRAHVRECIARVRKFGVRVRPGTWSVRYDDDEKKWRAVDNQCCPLGAVLIVDAHGIDGRRSAFPGDSPRPGDAAAKVLRIHRNWVGAFCEGAGGVGGLTTYPEFEAAWQVGRFVKNELEGGAK